MHTGNGSAASGSRRGPHASLCPRQLVGQTIASVVAVHPSDLALPLDDAVPINFISDLSREVEERKMRLSMNDLTGMAAWPSCEPKTKTAVSNRERKDPQRIGAFGVVHIRKHLGLWQLFFLPSLGGSENLAYNDDPPKEMIKLSIRAALKIWVP